MQPLHCKSLRSFVVIKQAKKIVNVKKAFDFLVLVMYFIFSNKTDDNLKKFEIISEKQQISSTSDFTLSLWTKYIYIYV